MDAFAVNLSRSHIKFQNAVHLVTEKLDPNRPMIVSRRKHLYDIPAHPEPAALKGNVVALVLHGHKLPQNPVPIRLLPLVQGKHHLMVAFRGPKTIDAGHAGNNDHIPPLEQGAGRRVAQFIDLVIDGGILLDIGVRGGHIGLRLVVIVVAYEIPHVIVRKKSLELAGKLCRQRLVVGDDQGRLLHLLDDLCDGIGLARSRRPQKHLRLLAVPDSRRQIRDCLGLVAHGLKRSHHFKRCLFIKLHRVELWHRSHSHPPFSNIHTLFFIITPIGMFYHWQNLNNHVITVIIIVRLLFKFCVFCQSRRPFHETIFPPVSLPDLPPGREHQLPKTACVLHFASAASCRHPPHRISSPADGTIRYSSMS